MADPSAFSEPQPDIAKVKGVVVKFKNQLQELAHKAVIALPDYTVVNEGFSHSPCFRATVEFNGKCYTTIEVFKHRKEAEQEAARLALEDLGGSIEDLVQMDQEQWTVEDAQSFLPKLVMFWKSIFHEFATKDGGGLPLPEYCTVPAGGTSPFFVSHTKYKEVTYPAVSGRSKKEAEQLAACIALQTLLGDAESSVTLVPIIKMKAKHFSAMQECSTTSASVPQPLTLTHASSEKVLPVPANPGLSLPIEFVLASGEQNAPLTSSRKRRKSRKGAKKRARQNVGMDPDALAQVPSVSQPMGVSG